VRLREKIWNAREIGGAVLFSRPKSGAPRGPPQAGWPGRFGHLQTAGLISSEDRGNLLSVENVLVQIKQLVIRGRVTFTDKADEELLTDDLTEDDVCESLVNAKSLRSKRSRSPFRRHARERVYIIVAPSYSGIEIYTKGVFRKQKDSLVFYILISSKRSTTRKKGG
jgi:hypothetical protein